MMRQATQQIVGPQGQRMTRTAIEHTDPGGLQVQAVFDVIDLDWLREEYMRSVPLWRRVWLAIMREVRR